MQYTPGKKKNATVLHKHAVKSYLSNDGFCGTCSQTEVLNQLTQFLTDRKENQKEVATLIFE